MKQNYYKRLMASACSILMCGSLICNTMLYTEAAPGRQIQSIETQRQTEAVESSEQTAEGEQKDLEEQEVQSSGGTVLGEQETESTEASDPAGFVTEAGTGTAEGTEEQLTELTDGAEWGTESPVHKSDSDKNAGSMADLWDYYSVLDEKWDHFGGQDADYPWTQGGNAEVTQADGVNTLKLKSVNGANTIISLNTSIPKKNILEFKARINSFGDRIESENRTSLGMKIGFGTSRIMFSVEKDKLYYCTSAGTWAGSSAYEPGNDWHVYRFETDADAQIAKLYIDDSYTADIRLQTRNDGETLQFWAQGSDKSPAEAEIAYVQMSREISENEVPLWNMKSKVTVTKRESNSLSINWTPSGGADKYQIYVDDTKVAEVPAAQTACQIKDLAGGTSYRIKVEAENKNGLTATGPVTEANTLYDISSGEMTSQTLMRAGDGYNAYRIPSLVTTSQGTLLATSEARSGGSDWSPMDAVLMRSTDGGETWEERKVLAAGLDQGFACNNPVLLATKEGPVFFIYCKEYGVESRNGGVFYQKSLDDGITWSEPVDISASCVPDYRNVIATGPGHGIQLQNGRLILAVWMVPKSAGQGDTSHHPGEVSTLYSDDMGETWHIGEMISGTGTSDLVDPNESTIVELSDGRVMVNMRNQTGTNLRAVAISPNGSDNWSEPYFDEALNEPVCFGSLVRYDENTLLFVNPDTTSGRTRGTVKVSYDDGKTWPVKRMLNESYSSYADITVSMVDGIRQINVLMETNPGDSLTLFRFPLSWVEQNSKNELKSLHVSAGSLKLEQGLYHYPVEVGADTDKVTIQAQAFDPGAQLSCNGQVMDSGKFTISLGALQTDAKLTVKLPSGEQTDYTLTFIKTPPVSGESCVVHYTLDSLDGNLAADASGYGNDAVITGKVTASGDGKFGGCGVMGNGETYLQVADGRGLDFGTGDFTASMWIKPTNLQGQRFLFWYGNYSAGSSAWWCRLNGSQIDFLLSDGGEQVVTASNAVTLNAWAHVALVSKGNTYTIYVNGKAAASAEKKKEYNVNGENILRIGAQKANQQRVFEGYMDEIQIFNYALNDKDITDLMDDNTIVSAAKDILMLSAGGQSGKINGTEITLYQPLGTDVSQIAPEIAVSPQAVLTPSGGTVQDFTNPVQYTVTAQNGTVKNYTVTVVLGEEPNQDRDIRYVQPEPVKVYPVTIKDAESVKVNLLGDSITYGQDPLNGGAVVKQYHEFLADQVKLDNLNYGVRGSTISVLRRGGDRDPFTVRYADMRDDADVVFVFGGTNDYGVGGAPFGTWQDRQDKTFLGGLRVLLEGLIEKYPGKQIVFMTPIRRGDRAGANGVGKTLSQYVTAIKMMCEEYGVPVLDAYSAKEMNLLTDREQLMADGLHPSAAGHEKMSEWIYKQLQEKKVIQVTIPAESIRIDQQSKEITVSESFMLSAEVMPENATDRSVLWTSSDPKTATVENGKVTALAPGKAVITAASADGKQKADCMVTVKSKPVPPPVVAPTLTLNKSSATIYTTGSKTVKLTANVTGPDKTVNWVSSNTKIAVVKDGMVTAISAGHATITAAANGIRKSCEITVRKPALKLSSSRITLYTKGKTKADIKAAVTGPSKHVVWKTSDKKTATVKNGRVTAKKAGIVTITAKANGITKRCTVTVKKPSLKLGSYKVSLKRGKSKMISAKAKPQGKIKYKSAKSKIASVTKKGRIKAHRKGRADIKVTCNGVRKVIKVTVR